jgi:ATP-dependent protease ClpP protease subunit
MASDRPQWYQIRNAAPNTTGPAELLIYDVIDSWMGVSAEQLVRDIAALDSNRALTVRINSPGGNVYDGVAILNALRNHPGTVTCVVDGLAASAASVIAMGGDEIVMNRNAEMMVHNGSALVMGGAQDMRKMADRLDAVNANLASVYAERAGGTPQDWRAVMDSETWYSAEEAVAAGLADRVDSGAADARAIAAKFDLSIFAHAGRQNAPAPVIPAEHKTPLPVEAEVTEKGERHHGIPE